jgi:hypothetical protein
MRVSSWVAVSLKLGSAEKNNVVEKNMVVCAPAMWTMPMQLLGQGGRSKEGQDGGASV